MPTAPFGSADMPLPMPAPVTAQENGRGFQWGPSGQTPPASAGGPAPEGRPQSAGKRLRVPAIDGFRGYAALAVVLIHVTYYSGRPILDDGILRSLFVSGYMGVDFFFVISGFVLFLPAVTRGGDLGNLWSYGQRRAARILPAYYVMLAAIIVLHPLLAAPVDLPHTSLRGLLSLVLHLTFLEHTVGAVLALPMGFAVNNAVWTLTLEAAFYILLPLVAGWYYRRPFLGLAAALVVGRLWEALATSDLLVFTAGKPYDLRVPMAMQLPTYLGHFAAGMTAAWLFVKLQKAPPRVVARLAVPAQALSLLAVILIMRSAGIRDLKRGANPYSDGSGGWHFDHWTHTGRVGLAFASLILATALAPRWAQWPATNRLARRLGDVSYGIYLWHFPIIMFAFTTLGLTYGTNRDFFLLLAVTLPGSIVAGFLSFALIERPCIRWAQKRSRAREHRPEPAPAARAPALASRPVE